MVAGQARHVHSSMEILYKSRKDANLLHALIRDSVTKSSSGSSRPIGSVNTVPGVSGNTTIFTTPIALHPKAFLIVSDEADTLRIDKNFGAFASRVIVTGEGGVADNLEFIIGKDDGEGNIGKAAFAGQILNIEAVLTTPITLINGTDIATPGGGASFVIDGGSNVTLIYDSTLDKWKFLHDALVQRLDELLDVTIVTPATGEHLEFTGTVWENKADITMISAGADIINLDDILFIGGHQFARADVEPHLNLVMSGDTTFRMTVNATDVFDVSDLASLGIKIASGADIYLQGRNLYLDSPAATRSLQFDGVTSVDLTLPVGDSWRVIVGAAARFAVDDSNVFISTVDLNMGLQNIDAVTDIQLQAGFLTSKLFFDGGGDTYFTGSGISGRINIVTDNINNYAFGTTGLLLFLDTFLQIDERTDAVGPPAGATGSARLFAKQDAADGSIGKLGYVTDTGVEIFPLGVGGQAPPFDDNQVIIQDEVDNTKTLQFNLSLLATGNAHLFNFATSTGNRTYTFPDDSGTVALLAGIQIFTGFKTFEAFQVTDATPVFVSGSIQPSHIIGTAVNRSSNETISGDKFFTGNSEFVDGVLGFNIVDGADNSKVLRFAAENITTSTTITWTIPDIVGTVAILEGAQTFLGIKRFNAVTEFSSVTETILGNAGGMEYRAAVGKTHEWFLAGGSVMFLNATKLDLQNLNIEDVDEVKADTKFRANTATEVGYFVSNFSGSVGNDGSVELPATTTSLANKGAADTAFGAIFGACGLHDSGSALILYIRQNNGDWAGQLFSYGALI